MEIKLALTLVVTITGLSVGSAQAEDRTIDGSGNNIANPDWGSAGTQLLRLTLASYDDLTYVPAGGDRPSARAVSNGVRGAGSGWRRK